MKTFVLKCMEIAILSFLFSIGLNAQTINGIGKLQLGMTLNEVKSAFPTSLVKMASSLKVKKVYKINSYTPIKDHICKDIRLYFYNDTLYTIYVNNAPTNLRESLSIKYGKPKQNSIRFRYYVEELATVYQNDASDFLDDSKSEKWDIIDTYDEWNNGNPFVKSLLWMLLYENGDKGPGLDCVFYVKNLLLAKCVELEEKKFKMEEREKKKETLEGL